MRGQISQGKWRKLNNKLPVLDDRLITATTLGDGGIEIHDVIEEENLSIAFTCLADAGRHYR
ncbi:MAG: hypothetical protein AAF639_08510 [Chloroflexota bacterium]